MYDTESFPVTTMPRLNVAAPAFEAKTTHGIKKLADYAGKWLVLFSHPADFTPVCTTEFIAFAKAYPEFQKLNCELLGLSIDSYYSHVAWVRTIKEKFGVEIPFPIIDDLSMRVAHAYGMIHPGASDTSAVRATFVIDDKGILRAMVYYPMSNGRSIAEFLRLVGIELDHQAPATFERNAHDVAAALFGDLERAIARPWLHRGHVDPLSCPA